MILISVAAPQHLQYHEKGERERQKRGEKLVILISVAAPQHLQYHQKGERKRRKAGDIYERCGTATPTIPSEGREREERGEKLVILISVAAPQHLQYHQKGKRERRKAGDIYKCCGAATPTIPSEGREREAKARRKAVDNYKHCDKARQNLQYHQKGESERRKAGDIYKRCGTATPTIPSEGRERKRERGREREGNFGLLKCLGLFL